jgi:hypothetical protein
MSLNEVGAIGHWPALHTEIERHDTCRLRRARRWNTAYRFCCSNAHGFGLRSNEFRYRWLELVRTAGLPDRCNRRLWNSVEKPFLMCRMPYGNKKGCSLTTVRTRPIFIFDNAAVVASNTRRRPATGIRGHIVTPARTSRGSRRDRRVLFRPSNPRGPSCRSLRLSGVRSLLGQRL